MKMTSKLLTICVVTNCLLAVLPLQAASVAFGQTIVGRVSGTVTDTSGGAIQGATIKITNDATGVSRTANTDDSGFYLVTNLPPGNYTVSAEQAGFKKALETGYVLVADGRLTVDVSLEPGAVSDSVTVTAPNTETINRTSEEVAPSAHAP